MSDIAAYLAAVVLLGLAGYRAFTEHGRSHHASGPGVYGFIICEGLAMTLLAPATSDLLARIGVGTLWVVLLGDVVRTAAIGFLMLVAYSLGPRPHGIPTFVIPTAAGVQIALAAMFLGARPAITLDGSLAVHGAGRLLLPAHDALFAVYAIWCLIIMIRALGHEARRAGPGMLRIGLRLALAAACVGVAWSAWTADDVASVLRTGVQDGTEDLSSNLLGAVCATLVVAGATVAKWGDTLAAPLRWLRAYRTYARLAPLWDALHAQLPQIALAERRGLGAAPPTNAEFALYRRMIEIHDGRFALRPYAPARAAVAAALAEVGRDDAAPDGVAAEGNPAADDAEPWGCVHEAVWITAGLANLRAGRRAERSDGEPQVRAAKPARAIPDIESSRSMRDEAAWLLAVTEAFAHSPAVPAALELLGLSEPHAMIAP